MAETLDRQHVQVGSADGNDSAGPLPATSDKAPPVELNRLLDLDWQKALIMLLTILAGLALTWCSGR